METYALNIEDAPKGTYAKVMKYLRENVAVFDYNKPIFTYESTEEQHAELQTLAGQADEAPAEKPATPAKPGTHRLGNKNQPVQWVIKAGSSVDDFNVEIQVSGFSVPPADVFAEKLVRAVVQVFDAEGTVVDSHGL